MGKEGATARTKHSPHGPVKAPSGLDFLMVPNGRLCEDAMDPGGADQADMMRLIDSEEWGDIERSRTWLVKHLGLHALLPDTKHVPEDLKAKMAVRVNTQGV